RGLVRRRGAPVPGRGTLRGSQRASVRLVLYWTWYDWPGRPGHVSTTVSPVAAAVMGTGVRVGVGVAEKVRLSMARPCALPVALAISQTSQRAASVGQGAIG